MSAERDHIRRVLEETGGNKKATARLLGLSRRALYRRLDKLGLR
jgi:ActR/RegA family two-component response regulator